MKDFFDWVANIYIGSDFTISETGFLISSNVMFRVLANSRIVCSNLSLLRSENEAL